MIKDQLNANKIQANTHPFYEIHIVEQIDSTNDFIKRNSNHLQEGFTCIANNQSHGKGRGDHQFHCVKDTSIYVSFLLRPKIAIEDSLQITILASLAVVKTIEHFYSLTCAIKWVNDIFIEDKKVCGILCESHIIQQHMDSMIVGIGINLHSFPMPSSLAMIAGCVEDFSDHITSRNDVIAYLLTTFYEYYQKPASTILSEYKTYCNTIGNWIKVIDHQREYFAKALDINEHGHLLIEVNNKKIPLVSGEVHIQKL